MCDPFHLIYHLKQCYGSWLIPADTSVDFPSASTAHLTEPVLSVCLLLIGFFHATKSLPLAHALVFPLRCHGRWFWQSMVAGVRMHYCHRASAHTYQSTGEEDRSFICLHLWVSHLFFSLSFETGRANMAPVPA